MSALSLSTDVKTSILFKKYLHKSSSSHGTDSFSETETPESRYSVLPYLQLYTQGNLIPNQAPDDLDTINTDDIGSAINNSYIGKTSSTCNIIKKYVSIPLVEISSSCGRAFQAPNCLEISGLSGTITIGEIFKGSVSQARGRIYKSESNYLFFQNVGGYHIDFKKDETISSVSSSMTATVAKIPDDTITHRVLRDAIPSDFAINNDSYYHELYKSDEITQIFFGDGDWLLDTFSGVLTFYGSLPENVSGTLTPRITFYRYIGKKGLNTTHTTSGNVGIGTETPAVSLHINKNDAISIPVGNTSQRPSVGNNGYLRYNSETDALEGYMLGSWKDLSLGLGNNSNNVNIGTGGSNRNITIGDNGLSTNVNFQGNIRLSDHAFYFATNDNIGNWRIIQQGSGASSTLVFQQSDGTSYVTKYTIPFTPP